MPWIESHDGVWDHWKTRKFQKALDLDIHQAVGLLHALWHFTLRNAWKDSNLEPWGAEGIAEGCRYKGDPDALISALRDAQFLDGFVVHDWQERAGKLVQDRRYNEDRRKNAVKRRKTASVRRKTDATLPHPTSPYPTQPNQETARAEAFVKLWNDICGTHLPKAQITDKRRTHIKARLVEYPGLEYWARVMKRMIFSDFLNGKNDRGWTADIEWLTANDNNHVKVIEGKYDNKTPFLPGARPVPKPYRDPAKEIKPEDLLTAEDIEKAKEGKANGNVATEG